MVFMDPDLSRTLNHLSLEQLSQYLNIKLQKIEEYYSELLDDSSFLNEINDQIIASRKFYQNAIFKHDKLDSIDWFTHSTNYTIHTSQNLQTFSLC